MRVLVCGGRDYRDVTRIHAVLNALDRKKAMHVLIHGGASGVDAIAGSWADDWGIIVEEFSADWAKLGRAAGPIRNQKMLDEGKPDLVVAFPGGRGTADMVRRARDAGVPVEQILI